MTFGWAILLLFAICVLWAAVFTLGARGVRRTSLDVLQSPTDQQGAAVPMSDDSGE